MLTQIELDQLAVYMTEVIECDPDYEEDQFGLSFLTHRCYVERHRDHFRIEVVGNTYELPR